MLKLFNDVDVTYPTEYIMNRRDYIFFRFLDNHSREDIDKYLLSNDADAIFDYEWQYLEEYYRTYRLKRVWSLCYKTSQIE